MSEQLSQCGLNLSNFIFQHAHYIPVKPLVFYKPVQILCIHASLSLLCNSFHLRLPFPTNLHIIIF